MGLGKTLQTLALCLSNPPADKKTKERCNVFVCPKSVVANWQIQIDTFVNPKALKVAVYQGAEREATLRRVKKGKIDVLLVSYETLVSDYNIHMKYIDLQAEKKAAKAAKKAAQRRDEGYGSDDGFESDDDSSDDEDDCYLPSDKKKKFPSLFIFNISMHRIILDEAHCIRNSGTSRFKAVMTLNGKNKLCITGTPYVNKVRCRFAFATVWVIVLSNQF